MPSTHESQTSLIKHLLPRGHLLTSIGSGVHKLAQAIAEEFSRLQLRAAALLEEADPRTATETLPEWERVLGLPDTDVTTIPATTAARRLAVAQKMVARPGGQSPAFYIALAAACGYTVTIDDTTWPGSVFRCGDRCGARIYGAEHAHHWFVYVSPPTGSALSHAELEAVIRRAAPTHTVIAFTYL